MAYNIGLPHSNQQCFYNVHLSPPKLSSLSLALSSSVSRTLPRSTQSSSFLFAKLRRNFCFFSGQNKADDLDPMDPAAYSDIERYFIFLCPASVTKLSFAVWGVCVSGWWGMLTLRGFEPCIIKECL